MFSMKYIKDLLIYSLMLKKKGGNRKNKKKMK